jgi:hypothetical protein
MTTFDAGTIVGRPASPIRQLVYPRRCTARCRVRDRRRQARRDLREALDARRELGSLGFFLDLSMNRVRSRATSSAPRRRWS